MDLSTIVDRISTRILGSPLAIQVDADLTVERLAQRQALAAERQTLDAQELDELRQRHDPALAEAGAAVRRCEAALHEARVRFTEVERGRDIAAFETSQHRDRLERALRETASPAIGAFLTALQDLSADTSRQIQVFSEKNHRTDATLVWTNYPATVARLAAIRHAEGEARALRLEALDDAELAARLAAIRAAIPDAGPMTMNPVTRAARRLFGGEA